MPNLITRLLSSLKRTPERKESTLRPMIMAASRGATWTSRRFPALTREAYIENVVGYSCVRIVAEAIATLPIIVRKGDHELGDEAPIVTLLKRPSPLATNHVFLEHLASYFLLSGNAYVEAVRPSEAKPPLELYVHRSDRFTIEVDEPGSVLAYRYRAAGQERAFIVDRLTGRPKNLLHIKRFHPLDDLYGLSPIEPGAKAVDQHNAAAEHNAAMLQNGARPDGILTTSGNVGFDEMDRIAATLEERHGGPRNAGRPMILGTSAGSEWKWLGLTQNSKDMEFWDGVQQSARDICAAFGVPHILVVPGESTLNNRAEARAELYESTVLPTARILLAQMIAWLGEMHEGPRHKLSIEVDEDRITALAARRQAHRTSVLAEYAAGVITLNEARDALDYDEREGPEGDGLKPMVPPVAASDDEDGDDAGDEADGEGDAPPPRKPGGAKPKPGASSAAPKATARIETKALDPDEVASELPDDDMIALLLPEILESIRANGQQTIDSVGVAASFDLRDPKVSGYLREYGARRVRGMISETTKEAIGATLAEGVDAGESTAKLVKRVRSVFADASRERAALIAATELTAASGFAAQQAMEQVGVEYKRWVTTEDDRVRASHEALRDKVIGTGQKFRTPDGDSATAPGLFAKAANSVGCRCHVVPYIPGVDGPEPESKAIDRAAAMDRLRRSLEPRIEEALRRAFEVQERAIVAALQRALRVE